MNSASDLRFSALPKSSSLLKIFGTTFAWPAREAGAHEFHDDSHTSQMERRLSQHRFTGQNPVRLPRRLFRWTISCGCPMPARERDQKPGVGYGFHLHGSLWETIDRVGRSSMTAGQPYKNADSRWISSPFPVGSARSYRVTCRICGPFSAALRSGYPGPD